jgi:hypothetical protein
MKPTIIDITGIGPAAANTLGEHGFSSLKSLARASVEQVATVPGFSTLRAQKAIAAAAELLAESSAETDTDDKPEKDAGGKNKKDKKKHKKRKKAKKNKKDKKRKKDKTKSKK